MKVEITKLEHKKFPSNHAYRIRLLESYRKDGKPRNRFIGSATYNPLKGETPQMVKKFLPDLSDREWWKYEFWQRVEIFLNGSPSRERILEQIGEKVPRLSNERVEQITMAVAEKEKLVKRNRG